MHLPLIHRSTILVAALVAVVSGAPATLENEAASASSMITDVQSPTPTSDQTAGKAVSGTETATTPTPSGSTTTRSLLPMASPSYMPSFPKPDENSEFKIDAYPERWKTPQADHPEIQAAVKAIDWSHVPAIPMSTKNSEGNFDFSQLSGNDEGCWWTATGCMKPKVDYLPEDVSTCSTPGDWALTFDDGPLNPRPDYLAKGTPDPMAAPALYDYLKEANQSATMFYVGSNIVSLPKAALRAYKDGHDMCVHTWSHTAMTTLSNEEVVGELYWTMRAIKEATGVTPKCWRPPFGDVDDRVRSIAHQLGLRTILWDRDSQDWQMPSEYSKEGKMDPASVDALFQNWIDLRTNGTDTEHGHIGLQHEINDATMAMTKKWLPKLQSAFSVKRTHACLSQDSAHWETDEGHGENGGKEEHDNDKEEHDDEHDDEDNDDDDYDDDEDYDDDDDDEDDEDDDDDEDDEDDDDDEDDEDDEDDDDDDEE